MQKHMEDKRVVVFVDGGNFYHRMRDDLHLPPNKLNYEKFFLKLVSGEKCERLQEVRYYVGRVRQEMGEDAYKNQQRLFASLAKTDCISYHTGSVESRTPTKKAMKLGNWLHNLLSREDAPFDGTAVKKLGKIASKLVAIQHGEKEVDAMIVVDMVSMAYEDAFDVAYLVSADSDFIPAVKKVQQLGKEVVVASTSRAARLVEKGSPDRFVCLNEENFQDCWL